MSSEDNHKSSINRIESIVLSIIASVIVSLVAFLLRYISSFGNYLPTLPWLLVFCLLTIIAVIIINYFIPEEHIVTAETAISISIAIISLFLFVHILSIVLSFPDFNSGTINKDDYLLLIKRGTSIALGLCYSTIVKILSSHKKRLLKNKKSSETFNKTQESIDNLKNKIEDISNDFKKIRSIKGMNTALTSTIIPFKYNRGKTITTYLIANPAYPDYSWMFPGGHVYFEENLTPETVARSRAFDEAGLDVEIIDIYNSFDVREDQDELLVDNMKVFFPPHYFNLFLLDQKAKCYRDYGHEYHLDAVYVAKINNVNKANDKFKRVALTLPADNMSETELSKICFLALEKYYNTKKVKSDLRVYKLPEYVNKMLLCAHADYLLYLKGQGIIP